MKTIWVSSLIHDPQSEFCLGTSFIIRAIIPAIHVIALVFLCMNNCNMIILYRQYDMYHDILTYTSFANELGHAHQKASSRTDRCV